MNLVWLLWNFRNLEILSILGGREPWRFEKDFTEMPKLSENDVILKFFSDDKTKY